MRLLSWNVNGFRAVMRKGFMDWFRRELPDVLCLQETRISPENVPSEVKNFPGYFVHFVAAERRGYSGVALFSRRKPLELSTGFGIRRFDSEGRMQIAKYPEFTLFNVYFPNGKRSPERLQYKLDFYETFLAYVKSLRERGESIVVCGDFNTAHREIDLARPKENANVSGFLPEEREWIDRFISAGFVDTFRVFNQEPGNYTWWDYKSRARERNVGWRIDYFFISEDLLPHLKDAFIMSEVMGSDHCPVGIVLEF